MTTCIRFKDFVEQNKDNSGLLYVQCFGFDEDDKARRLTIRYASGDETVVDVSKAQLFLYKDFEGVPDTFGWAVLIQEGYHVAFIFYGDGFCGTCRELFFGVIPENEWDRWWEEMRPDATITLDEANQLFREAKIHIDDCSPLD